MKLVDIMKGLDYELIQGDINTDIEHITRNSKAVRQGSLFFCIRGLHTDGHSYAEAAVNLGAAALITDREIDAELGNVTIVKVADVRKYMSLISAAFYDFPAQKMKLIAVIGTKGKTTTAFMIKRVLEKTGAKAGLIGTIMIDDGEQSMEASFTTPESDELQGYLYRMWQNGCSYVVMEVSSQSYHMYRTHGLSFDYGIFTNISPDHIGEGEHKDFDDYFFCKKSLLAQSKFIIYNLDDELSEDITAGFAGEKASIGVDQKAEYMAENIKLLRDKDALGVSFEVAGEQYRLGLPGEFNVHNALAVIALSKQLNIAYGCIYDGLSEVRVAGRMEPVFVSEDFTVLIDYAHNAMSLESTLKVLRKYNPSRLIALFGCGGNRDKNRRFEMGEVSGRLADLTIVTSDNPRFEEPELIVDDIITGLAKTDGRYVRIVDRREAIAYALKEAKKGDIVLLAGKGHESYQEIKGVKYPMNEKDIIRELS